MVTGMVRCPECGKYYFTWVKLTAHLIKEHGYVVKIPDEEFDNT